MLFVCVRNAGRSRIAEAFFNDLARGRFTAVSAGTSPADGPHPEVVAAMDEVGIELVDAPGRLLTEDLADSAGRIITMGCNVQDACPALELETEDWGLEDPAGKPPEEVASIRDDIERRVRNLIGQLDREVHL